MQFYNPNESIDDCFVAYVRTGRMSGSYVYPIIQKRYDYVKDIYDTILLRDLAQKYSIRNKSELLQIAAFMMDNVSNILSPNTSAIH